MTKICVSNLVAVSYILFVLFLMFSLVYIHFYKGSDSTCKQQLAQCIGSAQQHLARVGQIVKNQQAIEKVDEDRVFDPLSPPYRRYESENIPPFPPVFNAPTQVYGNGKYQLVGYLYNREKPEEKMRLFQRRIDRNRYEYYATASRDPLLKIPLPDRYNQEISSDDEVDVPGYPEKYIAMIYGYEYPMY